MRKNIQNILTVILALISVVPVYSSATELRSAMYSYDYGQAVGSVPYDNQHVVCDTCPKIQVLSPYVSLPTISFSGKTDPVVEAWVSTGRDAESADNNVKYNTKEDVLSENQRHRALFSFDSKALSSFEKNKLIAFLDSVNKTGKVNIRVEGHACVVGPRVYNQILSEKRAKAVARIVENQGFSVGRIIGFGENAPTGLGNKSDRMAEVIVGDAK